MFTFKCCGCWTTEIDYRSSQKCQHDNEERMRRLERYRTETGKQKRVQRKINRAE